MNTFYTVHSCWMEGDGEFVDHIEIAFATRLEAESAAQNMGSFKVYSFGPCTWTGKYQIVEQTFGFPFIEFDWGYCDDLKHD